MSSFFNAKKSFKKSLHYKLLAIKLPREIVNEKSETPKKISEIISASEQVLSSLSNYKYPIILEIATPINNSEILFFVACPREDEESVAKTITAYYPYAQIEEVDDYTIFSPHNYNFGSIIKLNKPYAIPIKTYQNFDYDPLSAILNVFSKVESNEGAAIQIVIRPGADLAQKEVNKNIKEVRKGKNYDDLFKKKPLISAETIKSMFFRETEAEKKSKMEELKNIDETLLKQLETKLSSPFYNVNIRLVVSSPNRERAGRILNELESGFSQMSVPSMNGFKSQRISHFRFTDFIYKYVYRLFDNRNSIVLNVSEVNTF